MPPFRTAIAVFTLLVFLAAASVAAAAPPKAQLRSTSFSKQLGSSTQPSSLRVTFATQVSLTVSWRAAKLRQSRYNVYVDGVLRASTTSTSYTLAGLSCGRSYTVGVGSTLTKSAQISMVAATAACVTASAPPTDSQAPTTPGSLVVTTSAASSLALTWSASSDNVGVVRYNVYVAGATVGSSLAPGYTVSGLECGSAYQISVDAVDAAGNRSTPATLTAPTAACPDTLPPLQPANLYEMSSSPTSIGFSWSRPLDNVGVTGYAVFLNGSRIASVTNPGYVYTGLGCGRTYQVSVVAYDAAGNLSPSAANRRFDRPCSDTTAPAAPADINWISATASNVVISWLAATDNVGVAGYTVYLNGAQLQSRRTRVPLTIASLSCATSYKVAVDAYDAAGNHSTRTQITAITTACPVAADTTPPSTPGNLTISNSGPSGFTVNWGAATDNVAVTGYNVLVNGVQAGSTAGIQYPVAGLACAASFTVAVEAVDGAGNKSARAQTTATTAACSAPPVPTPTSAQLSVSTGGSDSTCVRGDLSKPCATFQRAYQLAQLGDTVQVNAGNYPSQLLTDVSGKTTAGAAVTFQASGTVNLASLALGNQFTNPNAADNLKFVGIHGSDAWDVLPGGNNITFDHVQTTNIYANGVNGYTVTNSDFGGCTVSALNGPCDNFKIEGNSQHVLLDHDTFHDFRVADGSGAHFECLFFADAHYVTISNSTFTNCEYYDIFVQTQTAGIGHVTITGNHFDLTWASGQHNRQTALNISDRGMAFDDWTINSNTFTPGSGFTWDATGSYSNFHFTGDAFGLPASCIGGASYVSNTWTSGSCNT